jgi:hypothetical protein
MSYTLIGSCCLSAEHDGDGNSCSFSDANIMASSSSPQTGSTSANPWVFSCLYQANESERTWIYVFSTILCIRF